jgi:hypothetical protein
MPLTSSSTLADVQAAYDDNAPPFRTVTQCEAFVNACSILLRRMPEQSGSREADVRFRMDLIRDERTDAQKWLEAAGGGSPPASVQVGSAAPRVTYASFENSRG